MRQNEANNKHFYSSKELSQPSSKKAKRIKEKDSNMHSIESVSNSSDSSGNIAV